MRPISIYDQIKTVFQDMIAPELHALRGDIKRLEQKRATLAIDIRERLAALEARRIN